MSDVHILFNSFEASRSMSLVPHVLLTLSLSLPPSFLFCTPAHAGCPRDDDGDLFYGDAGAVDILRQWQATQ